MAVLADAADSQPFRPGSEFIQPIALVLLDAERWWVGERSNRRVPLRNNLEPHREWLAYALMYVVVWVTAARRVVVGWPHGF